jgi:hypothetical protein
MLPLSCAGTAPNGPAVTGPGTGWPVYPVSTTFGSGGRVGAENVSPMLLPFPNGSEFLPRLVRPFRDLSRRLLFWWPLPVANKHEAISVRPAACRPAPPFCIFSPG